MSKRKQRAKASKRRAKTSTVPAKTAARQKSVTGIHLTEEERNQLVEQTARQVISVAKVEKTFSGPLPPPEDFEHYNRVLNGAADRILSMAEKEQEIREDGQEGILANDRRRINSAIWLGLALIAIAGIAVWNDNATIALPLGLVGVGAGLLRSLLVWWGARRSPE